MAEVADDKTLAGAIFREMDRVREIAAVYDTVENGWIAAAMMRGSIKAAQTAIGEGDPIAMLRSFEDLKGYEL